MAKKRRQKPTTTWGKIWYFIWHDNSLLSWVVNIALAFVLIKFIIYPGLGLIMGTSLPVVAVVSESMDHSYIKGAVIQEGFCTEQYRLCSSVSPTRPSVKGFDGFWDVCKDWYLEHNISKSNFEDFPFKNGFSKGDIIVLVGKKPSDIEVGDVIVFQAQKSYPIIHRVVAANGFFQTKGDHNPSQIVERVGAVSILDETRIEQDQVLGVAIAKIPLLGWIKIGLVELFNPPRLC
jgi:signal peptidase I